MEYKPGKHIFGQISTKEVTNLKDVELIKPIIADLIQKYNIVELGSIYYQFPDSGYTGTICLSESHIAFHTWPEFGYVTLDVFLCNYSRNNDIGCEMLFAEISSFFNPQSIQKKVIRR